MKHSHGFHQPFTAGCTCNPDGPWMKQIARNLTACDGGFLNDKKYILMGRDTKFTAEFRTLIEDEGTECALLPPESPNCKAHFERFSEVLNRNVSMK